MLVPWSPPPPIAGLRAPIVDLRNLLSVGLRDPESGGSWRDPECRFRPSLSAAVKDPPSVGLRAPKS